MVLQFRYYNKNIIMSYMAYKNCHLIIGSEESNEGQLWLGDYNSAKGKKGLKDKNISMVITAGLGLRVSYTGSMKHKVYPLYDSQIEKIERFFQDSYKLIDQELQRGNVLVHCFAGVSRSATIVIAYLMKKNNWSYKYAHDHVRKARPYINPNPGFIKQLKNFDIRKNEIVLKKQQQEKANSRMTRSQIKSEYTNRRHRSVFQNTSTDITKSPQLKKVHFGKNL